MEEEEGGPLRGERERERDGGQRHLDVRIWEDEGVKRGRGCWYRRMCKYD